MEHLGEKVEHLIESLASHPAFGTGTFSVTNYVFFMTIALVLTAAFFLAASRKVALVPQGLANVAEMGVEFVRGGICEEIIGSEGRRYFPFLGTLFFFILFNNLLGLIPGAKPGTGTMGVTVALAVIVFVYFTAVGVKRNGVFGYIKAFAPHGVPPVIRELVWLIEVFSNVLRMFTLSVRLFANMYAGHIILGVFATLIALSFEPLLEAFTAGHLLGALPIVAWLPIMIALYALELFVAFIQAYVFTVLTAVYIDGALHAAEH